VQPCGGGCSRKLNVLSGWGCALLFSKLLAPSLWLLRREGCVASHCESVPAFWLQLFVMQCVWARRVCLPLFLYLFRCLMWLLAALGSCGMGQRAVCVVAAHCALHRCLCMLFLLRSETRIGWCVHSCAVSS
jgi:hypothetical protein